METVYLRDTEVAARYGVSSVTVWGWTKKGYFPKPHRLGHNKTRWLLADLETWERKDSVVCRVPRQFKN